MKVLVGYATRHGATKGIADRIGSTLDAAGLDVTVQPLADVPAARRYHAFVLGSAAYMGQWLKEATTFVRYHTRLLAERPVWLFSSGPIGTDLVDKEGRDVVKASEPAEFDEFARSVRPRDTQVFFGAFDPDAPPIGVIERLGSLFTRLPSVREAMPAGDFRDWDAIDAWATRIASDLREQEDVGAGPQMVAAVGQQ